MLGNKSEQRVVVAGMKSWMCGVTIGIIKQEINSLGAVQKCYEL